MYSYKYLININIEYITIIYVILRLYNSLFNQKDGLILSSKSFGREEREERRGEGREPSPICYECFRKELEQTKRNERYCVWLCLVFSVGNAKL